MKNKKVLVIAEAGVNHNGDIEIAKSLIDAAVDAGADIVKFQTFKAKNLAAASAEQATYQKNNIGKSESQIEMLERLELKYEDHFELIEYCNLKGIKFLSTAFDEESLVFLTKDLNQEFLKIPSGELTNAPFLLSHAKTGLDIILSTGMASLSEIETALGVVAFGYLTPDAKPSIKAFESAYFSEEGKKLLKSKVSILHCTTEYPAPLEDINLNAMQTIKDAFKLNVGYSDHSEGTVVPVAAVATGACIIEKHFTLDRNMEGPDHKASLEPSELSEMISSIRKVELIMGDGIKGPRPSEISNKPVARKSLVAGCRIKSGELFTSKNLQVKRPGTGMSPYNYWSLIGVEATRSYEVGELITE